MKKVLYLGNVGYRFNSFAYANSVVANKLKMEFHCAASWTGYDKLEDKYEDEEKYGIIIKQIDFIRTPYDPRNIKAYKQVVELIKREKYDAIHCNTPIGGVVGRLAGKKCKVKKVIYQAHGFHFFKGAPLINWLLYYPIERYLAHYTDAIITINQEDYNRAKKFKLKKNGKVYYVPGVGINLAFFGDSSQNNKEKRVELGIPLDAIVLISVGDLNKNKNNEVIIRAINDLNNANIHYILCGEGPLLAHLKDISKSLQDRIHFLGYRTDIRELMAISDIFVMPSLREGLSRSLMEAMASGLPCIVSNIRGNADLIQDNKCLCNPHNKDEFKNIISELVIDEKKRKQIGVRNAEYVRNFSSEIVIDIIKDIYQKEI